MKKHKAQKDILYISISSFVLVLLWIGFSLYHAHVDSTITPTLQLQIEPIDPRFDTATIQELKERGGVVPVFELESINEATQSADNIQGQQPEPAPVTTGTDITTGGGGLPERPGE